MAPLNGKGNILVVDDEPQIARVLKTTLSSHGYGTSRLVMAMKRCR
jgi:CheY-like chemotaxis protein